MVNDSISVLKNRYYLITKNDEPFAYLSVKKDFYSEGILLENKAILVGYFNWYSSLDAHVIGISNDRNYLNGLSIIPKSDSHVFSVNGDIMSSNYCLYKANIDEYCNHSFKEEISCDIQIKKLSEETIIRDIDYLIRSSIRNLNDIYKQYYDMLKRHRYGNLKEVLNGIRVIFDDGKDLGLSDSVIKDLEMYLKTLAPSVNKSGQCLEKKAKRNQKCKKMPKGNKANTRKKR